MAMFIAEKSIPANSSSREGTERVEEGADDCRLIQRVYSYDYQRRLVKDY